ncbi:MAG: hypothetical protein ACI9CA_002272, partial [Natronomonas sp.]
VWTDNGTVSTNGGESVVQSGNSVTLGGSGTGTVGTPYTIDVVWTAEDGGTTQTLATFEG